MTIGNQRSFARSRSNRTLNVQRSTFNAEPGGETLFFSSTLRVERSKWMASQKGAPGSESVSVSVSEIGIGIAIGIGIGIENPCIQSIAIPIAIPIPTPMIVDICEIINVQR